MSVTALVGANMFMLSKLLCERKPDTNNEVFVSEHYEQFVRSLELMGEINHRLYIVERWIEQQKEQPCNK